jgi:hypothetical protein
VRWKGRRESQNVEDRRGMGAGGIVVGGGIGAVVIALLVMLLGGDPSQIPLPSGAGPTGPEAGPSAPRSPEEEALASFVRVVLADTEDVWNELFQEMGKEYREPTLVLFTGQVQSACGGASSAVGPFYCPGDQKVYIDLSFYDLLKKRFGAGGDFAQAYVIAHEIGHHVQNLLGISDAVRAQQQRVGGEGANALSVRLELQADFLAGVWAHHAQRTKQILEAGDVEEAIEAAEAIGDDHIQMQSQGYTVPDSFTHGSSAQRAAWFRLGVRTGDVRQGDTFDEATWNRVNPR